MVTAAKTNKVFVYRRPKRASTVAILCFVDETDPKTVIAGLAVDRSNPAYGLCSALNLSQLSLSVKATAVACTIQLSRDNPERYWMFGMHKVVSESWWTDAIFYMQTYPSLVEIDIRLPEIAELLKKAIEAATFHETNADAIRNQNL